MTVFEYASGLISIVVGLAVARVLGGIGTFMAASQRSAADRIGASWCAALLFNLVGFWIAGWQAFGALEEVCAAILAYHEGDFGRAVDLLLPLRHAFIRMGASHAQRDIFHQYLLEAAIAGGRLALARALLSERTLTKPNSLGSWMRYAAVLDQLGEAEAASAARARGAAVKAAA